jgi:cysteine desulfurase/selenocysteine lyase
MEPFATATAPHLSAQQAADITANPYKQDFPLLANNPDFAFVDSAATAQRAAGVIEAQKNFYETINANALRGLYKISVEATQAINDARAHVARFIGADDATEVVFTRNTTESLNLLAKAFAPTVLQPGDEVCISIMEHHSNLIPWQQVCRQTGAKLVYLRPNEEGVIEPAEIAAKIGPKTKIVSIVQVSNVLGVQNPVADIAHAAHEQGAYVIVDGAQSAPHMPVDVRALDADFFAFSAHKCFGPLGIGVLWGKKDLLEAMPPFLTGGEMIDSVTEDDAVWAPVPTKFEAGTQDAAGIVGTDAALTYIESVGFEAIQAREDALVKECMARFAKMPFIELVGPSDPARHHGVVSFNVHGVHPHDVASIVDTEDVAIRVGHHCAQPLLNWMGLHSCCRASFAFYNDIHDIDKLEHSLNTVWGLFANA